MKPTEQDLDRFVHQNIHCCLSFLVATLAQGGGAYVPNAQEGAYSLAELCDQAEALASPVDDYEEAALQAGYRVSKVDDEAGYRFQAGDDMSGGAVSEDTYETPEEAWRAACEEANLDPYQWEVYEHWAVDTRFAEHLIAQGEKVDTDFAGLCVWARTTTGQAISMDGVITRIWNEIHKDT